MTEHTHTQPDNEPAKYRTWEEVKAQVHGPNEPQSVNDKLVSASRAALELWKAIEAWQEAAQGDSNDAEHDAGFELSEAAEAAYMLINDLIKMVLSARTETEIARHGAVR